MRPRNQCSSTLKHQEEGGVSKGHAKSAAKILQKHTGTRTRKEMDDVKHNRGLYLKRTNKAEEKFKRGENPNPRFIYLSDNNK